MHIVWAKQPPPPSFSRALFLAGPTPRDPDVASWRPAALELLRARGFDGVVFVPEEADGAWRGDYLDQVAWESMALDMADAVLFWIPRDLERLPGFTSNVEWGVWHTSGKAVLGAPPDAPRLRYLHHQAAEAGVPVCDTLADTLDAALALLGDGAPRRDGERDVPLAVWQSHAFQSWYAARRAAGHRLDGARLRWSTRTHRGDHLFCWALQVNLHIPEEDRNKRSELLIARPDVAAVLAYHPGPRLGDCLIVLVREVRAPAATDDGCVHELPGGSTFAPDVPMRALAVEELAEETSLSIPPARLVAHDARQCAATLLSHRAHLFSVELTTHELDRLRALQGEVFGATPSERTVIEVRSLDEVLTDELVDWSNLGMILSVLAPMYGVRAARWAD